MPTGSSDISILRLEVLQKFMETFMSPPNLTLMNIFGSSASPSSTVKWESQRGGRGMTPFVPPGAPAPTTAPHGIAKHSAEAAYWKEKMYFDEEFLNNLRKAGTTAEHQSAAATLARELALLSNRSNRRKEWMFAQMLFNGSFDYAVKGGVKASVNYDIPDDHKVTLASAYNWDDGATSVILSDIQDGKKKISDDCGGIVDLAVCNSTVLKYMANDTTLRGILQKNAFGDGGLYKGNLHDIIGVNSKVLGALLDIPNFVIYDERYEIRAWLTSAVSVGQSWVEVDDVSDFETGQKIRFYDASAGTYEDRWIYGITTETNMIQLSQGLSSAYKASEDYVTMGKCFIPDDKFVMMATKVDGQPIAEYKEAPFGLARHYGQFTDKNEKWDPEGVYIRVQDKGIPILYQRDAVYILDVKETTGDALVTTTTTTTSSSTTTTAP
ncbi:MAG: major capsid protein [Thermotogota bacterium]|nr:major capsid protein [Thermotogota bacterium]